MNPFLPYLNNPNIEFIGKSNRFAIKGKITSIRGHVASYNDKSITLVTKNGSYAFDINDLKIVLRPITSTRTSEDIRINDLDFCISYPKPTLRDKDAESKDFSLYEVAKLTKYLIDQGIDVGIVPKKYLKLEE